jgi:HAMP domain-containing protein
VEALIVPMAVGALFAIVGFGALALERWLERREKRLH